jgi:hypothetical protein
MLCQWREDFAQLMRQQGIAANATPSVVRGPNKRGTNIYRGRRRGVTTATREHAVSDLMRKKVLEARNSVMSYWHQIAGLLDAQGEIELAVDVRNFACRFSSVLSDKEQSAQHRRYVKPAVANTDATDARMRDRGKELSR